MNAVPVESIPYADSNNQRFKVSAVHPKYFLHAWPQRTKPEDYVHPILRTSASCDFSHRSGIGSASAYGLPEQEHFTFSLPKVRIQDNEAELALLSALEDELITKKIGGSLSILDEVRLDSIQEQIDELIGVQSPTEAEQELLDKFNQLLTQSAELLGKLDKLMPDPEETQ